MSELDSLNENAMKWRYKMTPLLIVLMLVVPVRAAEFNYRSVATTTYQNFVDITTARAAYRTERAQYEAQKQELQKSSYGSKILSAYERSFDDHVTKQLLGPRVELFYKKQFPGGHDVETTIGSQYLPALEHNDLSITNYAQIIGHYALGGSEKGRSDVASLLEQNRTVMLLEIDFYKTTRGDVRTSEQAYFSAAIERHLQEHYDWYLGELVRIHNCALYLGDRDAIQRLEALMDEATTNRKDTEKEFFADLNLLRQRMGVHVDAPVVIGSENFLIPLPSMKEMIAYAVEQDPQIQSLRITKQSLERQREIINSASVDIELFLSGRTPIYHSAPDDKYALLGGFVFTRPNQMLQDRRRVVIDERLYEVDTQIDGWHDRMTLGISELYARVENFLSMRSDIEKRSSTRTMLYENRLRSYVAWDPNTDFDKAYQALKDLYDDKITSEKVAGAALALYLPQLLEYSGDYFKILREDGVWEDLTQ